MQHSFGTTILHCDIDLHLKCSPAFPCYLEWRLVHLHYWWLEVRMQIKCNLVYSNPIWGFGKRVTASHKHCPFVRCIVIFIQLNMLITANQLLFSSTWSAGEFTLLGYYFRFGLALRCRCRCVSIQSLLWTQFDWVVANVFIKIQIMQHSFGTTILHCDIDLHLKCSPAFPCYLEWRLVHLHYWWLEVRMQIKCNLVYSNPIWGFGKRVTASHKHCPFVRCIVIFIQLNMLITANQLLFSSTWSAGEFTLLGFTLALVFALRCWCVCNWCTLRLGFVTGIEL